MDKFPNDRKEFTVIDHLKSHRTAKTSGKYWPCTEDDYHIVDQSLV